MSDNSLARRFDGLDLGAALHELPDWLRIDTGAPPPVNWVPGSSLGEGSNGATIQPLSESVRAGVVKQSP